MIKTIKYEPKIFFDNFNMITEYSLLLEQTVKCYETSLTKIKEASEKALADKNIK